MKKILLLSLLLLRSTAQAADPATVASLGVMALLKKSLVTTFVAGTLNALPAYARSISTYRLAVNQHSDDDTDCISHQLRQLKDEEDAQDLGKPNHL